MVRILAALSVLAFLVTAALLHGHHVHLENNALLAFVSLIFLVLTFTPYVLAIENLFRKGLLRWCGAANVVYLATCIAMTYGMTPERSAEVLSTPMHKILSVLLLLLLALANLKVGIDNVKAKRLSAPK